MGLLLVGYLIYYLYIEHFTNSGQPTTTSEKTIKFRELRTKRGKVGNCTSITKGNAIGDPIVTNGMPGLTLKKALDICRKNSLCKGVDGEYIPIKYKFAKEKIPANKRPGTDVTKWTMLNKNPSPPRSERKNHGCFTKEYS